MGTVTLALAAWILALRASLPQQLAGDVVGKVLRHHVEPGESLIEIARTYDLGFGEIATANRGVDPFVPAAGSEVVVPTRWVVPRAAVPGAVVVNLSELRLYLPRRKPAVLVTFPVGIGDEGSATPLGTFHVVEKRVEPTWYPPESIRKEHPELPRAVPPGEDNPLGSHALRLSNRTILIHGTQQPFGVGRRVSHGCLRLYPEDISRLYEVVPVGTTVVIVREPVKVGASEGRPVVEVHDDPEVQVDAFEEAMRLFTQRGLLGRVDASKLLAAVEEKSGVPVDVTADDPLSRAR